jgi:hypothetical protein
VAKIYAGADNRITRWLPTVALEDQYPDPPAGTAHTLTFDSDGNAPLIDDLNTSTDAYRLSGSTLTKNGSPVAVQLTSPDSQRQIIDDLVALQATIQAAGSVTQLKSGVQDLRRILLSVVRTIEFPDE